MAALFCRWFEVADRRKCPRRAAGVSRVKSLLHNVHGPAEALPPTAIGFGKMDKVELRLPASRDFASQYGLSRGRVVSVFERLQAEGYVSCRVGSGTRVNRIAPVASVRTT